MVVVLVGGVLGLAARFLPAQWRACFACVARPGLCSAASQGEHAMSTPSRVNAPSSMQLDGRDLPLWPYDHLCSVEKKTLATKALDLRERIKAVPLLHAKHAAALRTGGDIALTIRWVLQVQADLLTARGRSEVFRGAHCRGGQKVRPGYAPDAAHAGLLRVPPFTHTPLSAVRASGARQAFRILGTPSMRMLARAP